VTRDYIRCWSFTKNSWSPVYTVGTFLMYIQVRNEGFICDTYFGLQSLLVDPDLSCQVNEQAADLFNSTEIAYKQKVKTIARRRLEG